MEFPKTAARLMTPTMHRIVLEEFFVEETSPDCGELAIYEKTAVAGAPDGVRGGST